MVNNSTGGPVVIGVDGSNAALRAALWAVDEAVSRDVPIRLLYAIDPAGADTEDAAHKLAAAEIAVRYVFTALESTDKSVKIEIEILQDKPTAALIRASASASMICVGAVGFRHFSDGHTGSTARALVTKTHCPVAIVRDHHHAPAGETGWIVALVDETADRHAVLQAGVEESVLRHAPLRVVAARHPGDEHAEGRLDRALAHWTHRHPGMDISCRVPDRPLDYLTEHASHIQLVLAGAHHDSALRELFSANGYAALHNTQCSLLIVNTHRAL